MTKLTGITSAAELRDCYDLLRAQWARGAVELRRQVGFQGGGATVSIWWRSDERVWAVFDESTAEGRFWCGFGTEDASITSALVPVVEINQPIEGTNFQLGGVLATDVLGFRMLLHTGQVAGGRRGIGKAAFIAWCSDRKRCSVDWGDGRRTSAFLIGRLGDSRLPRDIASYVRSVEEFKTFVTRAKEKG